MNKRFFGFVLPAFFLFSLGSGNAQSYSGDARKIGMGGIGYSENITTQMIEDDREYSSIVIPLGLLQLLGDFDRLNPDKDEFDPILAMEYAANPIHFTLNRDPGGQRGQFVSDIVDGRVNPDLSAYQGFQPVNQLTAEGLANPSWGKTFKFRRRSNGSYQGFYIGAGPYFSVRNDLNIDETLTEIFGGSASKPNETMRINNFSTAQLALAVTGGYRARFALPQNGGASTRNGIYVGVNYHYLRGFRYEDVDLAIRFDTDASGHVNLNPSTAPVVATNTSFDRGNGYALDFGIGAVIDRWEFGFGANGVGNRINWKNVEMKQWLVPSWGDYDDINDYEEHTPYYEDFKIEVKLPVEYIGNATYHLADNWTFAAEVSHGFQGAGFHGGAEYRLGMIELRGGGRYGLNRWHPSGGIGLNFGKTFSIDAAIFGTKTNIERKFKPAIALSIRLNRT